MKQCFLFGKGPPPSGPSRGVHQCLRCSRCFRSLQALASHTRHLHGAAASKKVTGLQRCQLIWKFLVEEDAAALEGRAVGTSVPYANVWRFVEQANRQSTKGAPKGAKHSQNGAMVRCEQTVNDQVGLAAAQDQRVLKRQRLREGGRKSGPRASRIWPGSQGTLDFLFAFSGIPSRGVKISIFCVAFTRGPFGSHRDLKSRFWGPSGPSVSSGARSGKFALGGKLLEAFHC